MVWFGYRRDCVISVIKGNIMKKLLVMLALLAPLQAMASKCMFLSYDSRAPETVATKQYSHKQKAITVGVKDMEKPSYTGDISDQFVILNVIMYVGHRSSYSYEVTLRNQYKSIAIAEGWAARMSTDGDGVYVCGY